MLVLKHRITKPSYNLGKVPWQGSHNIVLFLFFFLYFFFFFFLGGGGGGVQTRDLYCENYKVFASMVILHASFLEYHQRVKQTGARSDPKLFVKIYISRLQKLPLARKESRERL